MTFKDRFYQSYTSTHVNHRKGEAALDRFRAEFGVWEKHFGHLLPQDRQARVLDVGCGRGGWESATSSRPTSPAISAAARHITTR